METIEISRLLYKYKNCIVHCICFELLADLFIVTTKDLNSNILIIIPFGASLYKEIINEIVCTLTFDNKFIITSIVTIFVHIIHIINNLVKPVVRFNKTMCPSNNLNRYVLVG